MSNQLYWLSGVMVTAAALLALDYSGDGKIGEKFDGYIHSIPQQDQPPYLASPSTVYYLDPDTGFEASVPDNWQRISHTRAGDIGYTVSFESPASNPSDVFADYLMVEIQPAKIQSEFTEDPRKRIRFQLDNIDLYREQIMLDDYPVVDRELDLVVWQLILEADLHSVGIYVVGEQSESERLERVLLDFAHSFALSVSPFHLSQNLTFPRLILQSQIAKTA